MTSRFLISIVLFICCVAIQDITFFGAVKNDDRLPAQQLNQIAITQAIAKANSSSIDSDDRVVVIPKHKYYSLPIVLDHVSDVVIEVRGTLSACNRIKNYPKT